MKGTMMMGLLPLIVLSLFSIILGNEFAGINIEGISIKGDQTYVSKPVYFNLEPFTTGLAVIIVIAVACAIIGLRFLGSGLSEQSVRLLSVSICYTGIWAFLSLLAYPLIRTIEIFGVVLYILLTLLFTLGVIGKMIGE